MIYNKMNLNKIICKRIRQKMMKIIKKMMMMIGLIRIKKNKKRITKKKLITIIKLIRINKYMTKKILTNRKKKSKLKM